MRTSKVSYNRRALVVRMRADTRPLVPGAPVALNFIQNENAPVPVPLLNAVNPAGRYHSANALTPLALIVSADASMPVQLIVKKSTLDE